VRGIRAVDSVEVVEHFEEHGRLFKNPPSQRTLTMIRERRWCEIAATISEIGQYVYAQLPGEAYWKFSQEFRKGHCAPSGTLLKGWKEYLEQCPKDKAGHEAMLAQLKKGEPLMQITVWRNGQDPYICDGRHRLFAMLEHGGVSELCLYWELGLLSRK
jgi:hypothetical protein